MKDFGAWFEQFADTLTEAIELISKAGNAMADEPCRPRTAIAHLNAAHKLVHEAGKSVEQWVKKSK